MLEPPSGLHCIQPLPEDGGKGDVGVTEEDSRKALDSFIDSWQDTAQQTKKTFLHLRKYLTAKEGVTFTFNARPGISYSLRAAHRRQQNQPLFVLIDVIDDDPPNRWLSVCFYQAMITDPEERGDPIPQGLLGEDGYCFDVESRDDELLHYLEARLTEAHRSAAQGIQ